MKGSLSKLCNVRHPCLVYGVSGKNPDQDFRQAFRTVSHLNVELRGGINRTIALEARHGINKAAQKRRREAE